ncbi:MAG TPA: GNAT family N-acetyltransferase [Ktedonobacteraceae bacterium]|nr:GNAT family N-acetyltransferase [Ktedonobacteraceae bacterium]
MSDNHVPLIRTATPADIEALVVLCAEHAAYEGAIFDPQHKQERLASALFSATPRLYAWVVELHGQIVGFATATEEFSTWDAASFLHMDCLYLREEVRGSGLGRLLVREIARLALKLECINLQWQTPAWNQHAIRFYQRLGADNKQKVRFYLLQDTLESLAQTDQ